MNKDSTIRLLILDASLNDAEQVNSAIRTLGVAVRSARIEDLATLAGKLRHEQYDLCLCCLASLQAPLKELCDCISESGNSLPVVALTDPQHHTSPAAFISQGCVDAVNKDDEDHLKLVVAREFENIKRGRTADQLRKAYVDSERRAQRLMDSSRDAIAYVQEGMHVHANEAYLELLGFDSVEDIQGAPIMDLVVADDREQLKSLLRHPGDEETSVEARLQHSSGSTFSAALEFSPTTVDGERGIQIIIRDRTDTKELERQLSLLSQTDQLTGLYNRQHLMNLLADACEQASRTDAQYSLFEIRLEEFAQIRQNLGVLGADRVMAEVANVLRRESLDDDVLCRFEDATFTILSVQSEQREITQYARRLLKSIEEFICDVGGKSINPRCSIGIAVIDDSTPDPNEVLSRAEKALQKALTKGQTTRLYQPKPGELTQRQIDQMWSRRIGHALKSNQFHLLYQPIVSLNGDDRERYEVELRLYDETGKMVDRDEFNAAAERTGLAKGVDRWVIFNALKALAQKLRDGRQTVFFVPLTDSALEDPELFRWVRQLLEQLKLPQRCVVFQMRESAVITHLKQARALAAALHKINCQIALDNFGAEPNPFQLIKHVPADYLRLNHEFLKNLSTNKENQEAIQAITERARRDGQATIAPGVEDAGSLSVLWGLGTDMIQGSFLQPSSADLNYDFGAMTV